MNIYEPVKPSHLSDLAEGEVYEYDVPINDVAGPFFLQYQPPVSYKCSHYGLNAYIGSKMFDSQTILQFIEEYEQNVKSNFKKWVEKTQLVKNKKTSTMKMYEFMEAIDYTILEPEELDEVSLSIILSLDFEFVDGKFKISTDKFYPISYNDIRLDFRHNNPDRALFIKTPQCFKMLPIFNSGHVTAIRKITDPSSKYYNQSLLLDTMYGNQTLINVDFMRGMLKYLMDKNKTEVQDTSLCNVIFRSGELLTGGSKKRAYSRRKNSKRAKGRRTHTKTLKTKRRI